MWRLLISSQQELRDTNPLDLFHPHGVLAVLLLKSCTGEEKLIEFYHKKSFTSAEINAGSFWVTKPHYF